MKFNSSIVPPYVRTLPRASAALPGLYLKGISTSDMGEALPVLLGGGDGENLAPNQRAGKIKLLLEGVPFKDGEPVQAMDRFISRTHRFKSTVTMLRNCVCRCGQNLATARAHQVDVVACV